MYFFSGQSARSEVSRPNIMFAYWILAWSEGAVSHVPWRKRNRLLQIVYMVILYLDAQTRLRFSETNLKATLKQVLRRVFFEVVCRGRQRKVRFPPKIEPTWASSLFLACVFWICSFLVGAAKKNNLFGSRIGVGQGFCGGWVVSANSGAQVG